VIVGGCCADDAPVQLPTEQLVVMAKKKSRSPEVLLS
jgi:hypothetical protein